ncbi:MAG: hypothetical protein IKC10_05215 [Alphaproteobacteria bacterium]|nr:hypothetical protein [Alphaproteobacteria bacterium]
MKKAKDVKEFVERVDQAKKVNPKDLSSDQDLTIAIMNLISIEEHLVFSGAKTGKNSFYDLVEGVRELRKNLMQRVIPEYEGEVWCISKHLLSSSMRLMEVGTKQQSLGHKDLAYDLFNQAYDLYCLFWGLNMKMLDVSDVKWVEDNLEDIKKISEKLEENKAPVKKKEVKEEGGTLAKMKAFVKKAVDCCIE